MYKETTAVRRISALRKRIRAVSGGTGASKTVAILCWLIDYAQTHNGEVIDVVSESYPHLDLGAIAEFKRIMTANKYWQEGRWSGGAPRSYTFETGSVIQFISFDTKEKAHGPRRDVLFVNEANNIPWAIVDQLTTRTRKVIWWDWNPTEDFWFDEEVWGKRDDVDFMGDGGNFPPLTFLDNEALDEGQRNEILSHKHNANWWRVYGEGKKGQLEGRIYTGWKIIDEIPHEARLERHWLDFGYSNDPTAIGDLYYYNGGYILDEQVYQRGLHNKDIADILLNLKKATTIADSAEPKSIDDIRSYGVVILPCSKGAGSVNRQIDNVQAQQISVTKRSINLLKEYRNWRWIQDKKTGLYTKDPVELWDHHMKGIGYAMESVAPIIRRQQMIDDLPEVHDRISINPAL